MKNKFIVITLLFIVLIFSFFSSSFAFTEEEQEIINTNVEKMKEGSKNIGCKHNLTSGTNSIYFTSTDTIAGVKCNYVALMYWNNQFQITLTDDVITAKCVWYNTHELVAFMYDSDFKCIGYHIYNLPENDLITISKVNGYFKSTFTVKNSSGTVVEPFFYLPPLSLEEEITQIAVQQIIPTILVVIATVVGLLICVIGLRKSFQTLVNGLRT